MASRDQASILQAPPEDRDPLNPRARGIILGALRAILDHGPQSISMGEIADVAGVSRATLYRHFASKDELLLEICEHVSLTFEDGLAAACAREEGVDRFAAALAYQAEFVASEQITRLMAVEPMFCMQFVADHFDRLLGAMKEAMASVFDALETHAGRPFDRDILAETIVRLHLSDMIMPLRPGWSDYPRVLAELFASFVQPAATPTPHRAGGGTAGPKTKVGPRRRAGAT
ncbi:MAG: TetR/AcrR family transcriptional regulator [Janthinobacterium lividum]